MSAMIVNNMYLPDSGTDGLTFNEYSVMLDDNGLNNVIGDRLFSLEHFVRYSANQFYNEEGQFDIDNDDKPNIDDYISFSAELINPFSTGRIR